MEQKLFSQQIKALNTVDVRFDKRSDIALLNQDCIDKYQENAYLLGQIFSVTGDVQESAAGQAAEEEVKINQDNAAMEDEDEDDDDYDLG